MSESEESKPITAEDIESIIDQINAPYSDPGPRFVICSKRIAIETGNTDRIAEDYGDGIVMVRLADG